MDHGWDAHIRFRNASGRLFARALNSLRYFSLLFVLVGVLTLGLSIRTGADSVPVRVGVYENAPRIYTDAQGEVAGFWPDLVRAMAVDAGWQIEWVHGDWEELLAMLENNQIDMLPDVGWSEARSQIYAFNQESVLASWSILYTHSGTQIESLLDLEGKKVAGLKGSVNLDGAEGLRELLDSFGIRATIVEMNSYPAIFAALERGELDAGIANKDFGDLNEHNYGVVRTSIIFQPAHIEFAFTKDAPRTPDLIRATDAYLEAMKADPHSTYYRLLDQYLGTSAIGVDQTTFPGWVRTLLLGGGGLLILFLILNLVLRRMVNSRTAELRASEDKFRKAFMTSPDSITITRLSDGVVVSVNRGFTQIIGYAREEVVGKTSLALELWANPDDRSAMVDGLLRDGVVRNLVVPFHKKDGSLVYGLMSASVIDLDGVPHIISITRDMTERVEAENALNVALEKYRVLFESFPLGIAITDVDGQIVEANRASEVLLGLGREEQERRRIDDAEWRIVATDGSPMPAEEFPSVRALAENRQVDNVEMGIVKENDVITWISATAVPIPLERYGVAITYRDISERKLAELEVHQRAEQLAALLAASQFLTATLTLPTALQTITENAATVLNLETAAIYLVEGEALYLGVTTPPLPPDFPDTFRHARLDEHPHIQQAIRTHLPVIVADSETADLSDPERAISEARGLRTILYLPLFRGETVFGLLILGTIGVTRGFSKGDIDVCRMISNQAAISIQNARLLEQIQDQAAELEQRVQQRTAQLEAANQELEAFSYSVSHDLRAPLRAISGFSEIIARRHRADLNAEGQHYVDNVVVASKRMDQLIDDLLAYSRLGRSSIRSGPVALGHLLDEIRASVVDLLLAEVDGVLTVAEDLPTVRGDEGLLDQIFINLLENAIKYHQLTRPCTIAVDFQTDGDHVVVRVQDNGIGISPEFHDKIFTIFQRLHSEEAYPGTGIGLATVKKAVDLLNGSVWVESQIGQGSAFFVKLPKG